MNRDREFISMGKIRRKGRKGKRGYSLDGIIQVSLQLQQIAVVKSEFAVILDGKRTVELTVKNYYYIKRYLLLLKSSSRRNGVNYNELPQIY